MLCRREQAAAYRVSSDPMATKHFPDEVKPLHKGATHYRYSSLSGASDFNMLGWNKVLHFPSFRARQTYA